MAVSLPLCHQRRLGRSKGEEVSVLMGGWVQAIPVRYYLKWLPSLCDSLRRAAFQVLLLPRNSCFRLTSGLKRLMNYWCFSWLMEWPCCIYGGCLDMQLPWPLLSPSASLALKSLKLRLIQGQTSMLTVLHVGQWRWRIIFLMAALICDFLVPYVLPPIVSTSKSVELVKLSRG